MIEGKFKVPLLRGELDPSIDKFERIENRIGNNLDSWLCNLYFDIRHLPRYLDGQVSLCVADEMVDGITGATWARLR